MVVRLTKNEKAKEIVPKAIARALKEDDIQKHYNWYLKCCCQRLYMRDDSVRLFNKFIVSAIQFEDTEVVDGASILDLLISKMMSGGSVKQDKVVSDIEKIIGNDGDNKNKNN